MGAVGGGTGGGELMTVVVDMGEIAIVKRTRYPW